MSPTIPIGIATPVGQIAPAVLLGILVPLLAVILYFLRSVLQDSQKSAAELLKCSSELHWLGAKLEQFSRKSELELLEQWTRLISHVRERWDGNLFRKLDCEPHDQVLTRGVPWLVEHFEHTQDRGLVQWLDALLGEARTADALRSEVDRLEQEWTATLSEAEDWKSKAEAIEGKRQEMESSLKISKETEERLEGRLSGLMPQLERHIELLEHTFLLPGFRRTVRAETNSGDEAGIEQRLAVGQSFVGSFTSDEAPQYEWRVRLEFNNMRQDAAEPAAVFHLEFFVKKGCLMSDIPSHVRGWFNSDTFSEIESCQPAVFREPPQLVIQQFVNLTRKYIVDLKPVQLGRLE